MKRHSIAITVALGMALLLGACGGGGSGGGALTAVKTWFEALSQLDLNKVTELTCESQKATVEQAFSFLSAGGETDLQAMKELFNIDVSGLTYEEKGVSGNTATVHIAGELKVSAFGQEQTQPVDEDVPVVNEGGTWKVCATEVPGS